MRIINLVNEEQKTLSFRSFEYIRRKWERPLYSYMQMAFNEERERIIALPEINPERINDVITSVDPYRRLVLQGVYWEIAKEVYPMIIDAETKAGLFDVWTSRITRWMQEMGGMKVTWIDDSTRKEVNRVLTQNAGLNTVDLSREIDKLYLQQIIPNRSATIAQTETVMATNYAGLESMKSTGIAFRKVWLTARDTAVREAHADAEGQTVGENEDFHVGGEALTVPGDPKGSAWNVINCRCAVIFETIRV